MAGKPVEMVFEFESVRNFSSIVLHTNNMFSKDVAVSGLNEFIFHSFISYIIIIYRAYEAYFIHSKINWLQIRKKKQIFIVIVLISLETNDFELFLI